MTAADDKHIHFLGDLLIDLGSTLIYVFVVALL